MRAWKIAAVISCCWSLASGCCMCQHPSYDCGPVWSQGACPSCNPDYRAGSVLNRNARGGLAAESACAASEVAPQAARPALRTEEPAKLAAERTERSDSQVRAKSVAQQRQATKPAPAERQTTAHMPTERKSATEAASSPSHLPPATVAGPPGTKEGATRILSVTDRRLDELQRGSKPVATEHNLPQQTVKKPSEDLGGWRPVAPRPESLETANQSRETER